MLLRLKLLGYVSNNEGLADGLPAGDAERAVGIGIGAIGRRHENFARNLFHGAKHRLIADPAAAQGELKHHLFRRILGLGHVNLASWRELLIRTLPRRRRTRLMQYAPRLLRKKFL